MNGKAPAPRSSRALRLVGLVLGVLLLLVVVAAAMLLWLRSGPAFSEDEMEEASEALAAVRAELAEVQCTRPPLSVRVPAPSTPAETSLSTLVDEAGPFAACLREAGLDDVRDAFFGQVAGPDGAVRMWVYDAPATEALPPGPQNRRYVSPQHPPYRVGEEPPAYLRVEAACAGLGHSVTGLASREAGCSPFGPDTPGWTGGPSGLVPLARAIAVLARGRARGGDLIAALTLLLEGVAVFQDARRGPTSLMTAMLSVASEAILSATFNSLLIPEPGPSATQRAELSDTIDRLLESSPHPCDTFAGEALATEHIPVDLGPTAPETSDPELQEGLQEMMYMLAGELAQAVDDWCPREGAVTECFQHVPSGEAEEVSPGALAWQGVVDPNAAVRAEHSSQLERLHGHHHRYYLMLLNSPMALRQLQVMLALSGERQAGRCPTDASVDAALLTVPGASAPIVITHFVGTQYEVTAPPRSGHPEFELQVMLTLCPGAGGRWADSGLQD